MKIIINTLTHTRSFAIILEILVCAFKYVCTQTYAQYVTITVAVAKIRTVLSTNFVSIVHLSPAVTELSAIFLLPFLGQKKVSLMQAQTYLCMHSNI